MDFVSAACDKSVNMAKREKTEINVLRGRAIKAARKRRGWVAREVAEAVGVETGAVGNWESGQNAIASDRFFKVAEVLRIDAQALTKGELLFLDDQADLADAEIVTPMHRLPHGPSDVEQVGVVAGGADGEFSFNGERVGYRKRPAGLLDEPRVFALQIISDSMSPRYDPGEVIYCDAKNPLIGDDIVIEMFPEVEGKPGKAFVKRLVRRTKGSIVVKQFNPEKELSFDPYAIKHLWRVVPNKELYGY